MEIKDLADLGISNQLVASSDIGDLSEALKSIIENSAGWEYTHFAIVYGGTGSIRLFLQGPTEGAVSLQQPMRPLAVAHELIRFTETEADIVVHEFSKYSDIDVDIEGAKPVEPEAEAAAA